MSARPEIAAHERGDFCYTMCVSLKVEEPKKLSRGTIGNDADLLAGNLRWSYGDEDVNPRGQRAQSWQGQKDQRGGTARGYC